MFLCHPGYPCKLLWETINGSGTLNLNFLLQGKATKPVMVYIHGGYYHVVKQILIYEIIEFCVTY